MLDCVLEDIERHIGESWMERPRAMRLSLFIQCRALKWAVAKSYLELMSKAPLRTEKSRRSPSFMGAMAVDIELP